eukprot:132403_1
MANHIININKWDKQKQSPIGKNIMLRFGSQGFSLGISYSQKGKQIRGGFCEGNAGTNITNIRTKTNPKQDGCKSWYLWLTQEELIDKGRTKRRGTIGRERTTKKKKLFNRVLFVMCVSVIVCG